MRTSYVVERDIESILGTVTLTETVLVEVPAWANYLNRAIEAIDTACGHWFCNGGFKWFEKVPLGRPRYIRVDGEYVLDNNLSDFIYSAFGKALDIAGARERELCRIPTKIRIAFEGSNPR